MIRSKVVIATRPGFRTPAFFAAALALAVPILPATLHAQAPPPSARQPVPSELELAKLIWSTMAMIDHANRSGNYSVLRDSSASGFQINNDPARLAQIFAGLRSTRADLSNTLIVAPTYLGPPVLVQADVFEVKGYFPLRPSAIFFDLFFQWEQGRWKLFGVSVEPRTIAAPESVTLPAPAPASQPRPRRR
ncbi:MAG: hypothetical protein ABW203_06595 [Novosphingobium sp.]